MVDEAAGPAAAEDGDEDEQIRQLAQPVPGEKSWEAITRKRELIRMLEAAVKRDSPRAVQDARAEPVSMPDLAAMWKVTVAWIYTVSPARSRKQGTRK
jgi:hypothetical protein